MTARGCEFLDNGLVENVPLLTFRGDVLIRTLAQKLRDDAGAAGLTVTDLEIEGQRVEQFIREIIMHVPEPRTSGD